MNATRTKIEQLARKVAEDALAEGVPLETRLEALKILNPHYSILIKKQSKGEEEPDEGSFASFQRELERVDGGTETVRGRRGRRQPS
jgi:hypothetical protein